MIRAATFEDIPALTMLGRRFIKESGYEGMVNANPFKLHSAMERLLEGGGAIFLAESDGQVVGGIGLMLYELYFSDDRMAMELFWWMHPDHRKRPDGAKLLLCALKWARESGCKLFSMVDLPGLDGDAARMYERLGGKLMERTWVWRM